MTLFLFDIDGTLIHTAGVGRRAMGRAGERLFGYPRLFEGFLYSGALDPLIVARGMASRGITPTPRRIGRLRAAYLRELRRRMPSSEGGLMPGVREALAALREVGLLGLMSGNWIDGARIKLDHFDLWRPFAPVVGAFGGDALYRIELVPIAWRRARRRGLGAGGLPRGPRGDGTSRVVVIGDTPADVESARVGARALARWDVEVVSVAVRTGWAKPGDLERAGPDLLLDDLVTGLQPLLDLA